MAIGAALTIIATFMQTFAPQHGFGCFIAGRVLIGLGQGIALSELPCDIMIFPISTDIVYSFRTYLYWRAGSTADQRKDHDFLANVLLGWLLYRLLDWLCVFQERSSAW